MFTERPDHSTLEAIETASKDELSALQLKRMRWTLNHAYANVPLYKKKFSDAQVHPDDLVHLDDIQKFPFTTKDDLRDSYPFGMFAVPNEKVVRIHASSGTTGKPTVAGYTQGDIDRWADLMARSIRAAGGRRGDKVQVSYGYGLFTGGLGAHYGAERLGCTVIPISGGQTVKQVQLITDFRPDIIMVTPSYCLNIADELQRQGIDPKSCSLRIGVLGAEPWSNAMRDEIEERLGLSALDIYGLSEVMGPGIAQECIESKDGPTIWEDCFYPEIISTDGIIPIEDGQQGELVLTSLIKEAMPVIRYRTRDLTRLLPATARTMRRMAKITGRSDDMLIIRGVNLFPTQIEEQILDFEVLSPHYQLELNRINYMDCLTVHVELRNDFNYIRDEDRLVTAKELQHRIKSFTGVSAKVNVVDTESIMRSVGKAQRVVDKRIFD